MTPAHAELIAEHCGLARDVLELLKVQNRYFMKRNIEDLRAAKRWQERLKAKCQKIVKATAQPDLSKEGGAA